MGADPLPSCWPLFDARPAIRFGAALATLALLWSGAVVAQSADSANGEVRVGDRWVYETKDQITGYPQETYTETVTQISATEIQASRTVSGQDGSALVVFDRNWNQVDDPIWKYKPNDGLGIRLPLVVGKEWRSEFDAKSLQNSTNMRATVLSKVVAQETVTTPAGTFDTFRIERRVREFNTADPSTTWETKSVVWYAANINHWVRRTFTTTVRDRTRVDRSEELTEFTRNL